MNEMASLKTEVVLAGAVHGRELLTRELEAGMLDRPLFIGFLAFRVAKNMTNLGVGEQRCIEVDRLLGLSANIRVGVMGCSIS